MAGVSITIVGTKKGTVTDGSGKYHIDANVGDLLEFSYIGYAGQRVTVSGSTLDITLQPQASALNEVVVVGYGVQKKIDLTGSVATVTAKDIENRPVTNLSSSLAGLIPGAYIYQTSGAPGGDGASIQIRGNSTLSSTSPLVLIDGIIGSIDAVNPVDVESVSVLKDAASVAIYGAQGANGVILITTKKGVSGAPRVNYTGIFSSTAPTGFPQFVSSSVAYMNLINQAYTNVGNAAVFDSTTIANWETADNDPNGTTSLGVPNYVAYPNTNWMTYMIRHHLLQNHNVSVSGGSENTHYLVSLGYLNDPGLIANSGYQKYSFRINLEANIGKNITVGTQTFGQLGYNSLFDGSDFFNYLVQASPTTYPYWHGMYGSTSAAADKTGLQNNLLYQTMAYTGSAPETYVNTTWYGKVKIIKGLTFEPKVNYTTDELDQNYSQNPIATERWNFLTMTMTTPMTTPSSLNTYSDWSKSWSYTLESLLRYNTTIANAHNISALAGFNQYYYQSYFLNAQGTGLIDASIPAISTASLFTTNPTGYAQNWAMRSWFGEVNYNYKEKYLLEANVRNDASSMFGPGYRHGTFPSVSAGWNLAKESFLQSLQDHNIQSLKLRASWGKAGNANIGDYTWQGFYGAVDNSFNGLVSNGLAQTNFANDSLHWETTEQTDLGLDAVMFNKLQISFDWFRKNTFGILYQPSIDPTAGTASAPEENISKMGQNGIELTLGWHDKVGAFSYSVNGNFTYDYNNRVLQYKGPLVQGWNNGAYSSNIGAVSASSGSSTQVIQGHMINEYYLNTVYHGDGSYQQGGNATATNGPKTGMIRTPTDLAWVQAMQAQGYQFAPDNTVAASGLYYGDLIYADNIGQDHIFGGANNRKFMNVNTTAREIFGLNVSMAWKGLDFYMLWAGAAGKYYLWHQTFYNSNDIGLGGQIPTRVANNHYYYDVNNPSDPNNNINGYFPRLRYFSADPVDGVASDFWLYNASYVKLKSLQLGYTLPETLMGHVKNYIKTFRIYVAGENLLKFTKYPGPDPEAGTGVNYPLMKQYSFGVNAGF